MEASAFEQPSLVLSVRFHTLLAARAVLLSMAEPKRVCQLGVAG
jgi:hypothetical protein